MLAPVLHAVHLGFGLPLRRINIFICVLALLNALSGPRRGFQKSIGIHQEAIPNVLLLLGAPLWGSLVEVFFL